MERWRDDGEMERWRDGEMERWRDGEMERWRDGEMERWRDGEMERWRDGEMERAGLIQIDTQTCSDTNIKINKQRKTENKGYMKKRQRDSQVDREKVRQRETEYRKN